MRTVAAAAVVFALAVLAAPPALARDIYVSSETGQNDAAGTKEAPKKLLWKVLSELQPGDHIFVAEGRQEGQTKSGLMPKIAASNVIIEGGWKKDFSERDPFKYLSAIGAPDDQQGSSGTVFHFEGAKGIDQVTLDGFLIDRGNTNSYFSNGEPGANKAIEGHVDNSPWGYRELNRKTSGSDPAVAFLGTGACTIRNLILLNCPWWGIYVKAGKGTITIENNLILVSQGRGIEAIPGSGWGPGTWVIKNNTVAFNHSLKSTEGRALSIDPRGSTFTVEANVLAFSDGCGVDTKFAVKGDALVLKDNLFYFNRRGDAGFADEKGSNAKDFDDNLQFKCAGNVHELPKFLAKSAKEWFDRYSSREFVDMLAGNFNKEEELMAARGAFDLKEYVIPGYKDTYASYKKLPQRRNNYDMSRYPHPMKKAEGIDWAAAVLPILGADGARGVQPFKAR